jgi:DNA-binding transcriptional MocR family regulator
MVAPTYYLACRIFTDNGFDGRLKAVPEDSEGIDLASLEKGLQQSEEKAAREGNTSPKVKMPKPWRKIYKHIVYAVPTFSNPSGRIMSLQRRRRLVEIARKYDALIVTDDVYDMLQWPSSSEAGSKKLDKAILPRMVDVDREHDGGPVDAFGNAVSNGSFSKIVAPGVRTGWAEGTEAFAYGLSQTGSSRSGGAPSQLVASFMYDMLASGVLQKRILEQLQPAYAERYYRLTKAVDRHLRPLGVTMPQPDKDVAGGYFIYLSLPHKMDADRVSQRALDGENLTVIAGRHFRVDGDEPGADVASFASDLRLCFSWEDVDALEEGVVRLSRVIKSELSNVEGTSIIQ